MCASLLYLCVCMCVCEAKVGEMLQQSSRDITDDKGSKRLNLPNEIFSLLVSVSPKSEIIFTSSDRVVNILGAICITSDGSFDV